MRTRTQPVRLTDDERARCERLVGLYGGTISDVLRAGIPALEREHAREAPTIHLLRGGLALCGLPGMPRDWPLGHRWTSFRSPEDATCSACVGALAESSEPR